ncbi:hypothetical protein ABZY20_11420 [Streptomyces sp. NPDC006624]|uniref:hypothetical protein n=1 Tax=unclassified Streptomyces TaxID=2593676 RepID=UPI00339EBBAF
MTADQLPAGLREFASYLDGLLARLDSSGGWCAVFWQRDPEGMRACLDGREVPPWDVVEAVLRDYSGRYGPAAAGQETERARVLHTAALHAFDDRPGGRDALADQLDVMLREQRYAAERQGDLTRRLAAAPTREQADAFRLDLAWARDDHERASARCAELRARMARLDRPGRIPPASPDGTRRPPGPPPWTDPNGPGAARRAGDGDGTGSGGAGVGAGVSVGGGGSGQGPVSPPTPVQPPTPVTGGAVAYRRGPSPGGHAGPGAAGRGGGATATGQGPTPTASGSTPMAPGWTSTAQGPASTASGYAPTAQGPAPTASGWTPTAQGQASTASGSTPMAPDWAPTAQGPTAPGWTPTAPGPAPTAPGATPAARQPSPAASASAAGMAPGPEGAASVGSADTDFPAVAASAPWATPPGAVPAPEAPASPDPAAADFPAAAASAPRPGHVTRTPRPEESQASPTPTPTPEPSTTKQRKRRRGGARFAGMAEEEAVAAEVAPAAVPTLPAPAPATGRTPRGARFAGAAEETAGEEAAPVAGAVGAPERAEIVRTVEVLARLRGEGRSGEAHALLAEAAHWDPARFPLLAGELQRAGLEADWQTLLWEAASLPAGRLVAAADVLTAAGRAGDGRQMLRQGVARPPGEIGRAVLELAAEARDREVRVLLDAYVRARTPEEAARSVAPDPQRLVPLLLEVAGAVSDDRRWDLVHALRVAGFAS